jgi:hypothetical protein
MISQIRDIAVDEEGNIYILDFKEANVKVFDENGMYLRTMGKKGQGPGEIGMPFYVSITHDDEVLVEDLMNRRLTFYSLEGEHTKTISTAKQSIVQTQADSQGNIVGVVMDMKNRAFEVTKFSPAMESLCTYGSEPLSQNPQKYDPFKASPSWTMNSEDYVYFGVCTEYAVSMFGPNGTLRKKITKEWDPIRITQKELEDAEKRVPPPRIMEAPKYHYPIVRFILSDDGMIFVQTWERAEDSKGYYYDCFDKEGRYLFKTLLRNRPSIWKKGKLYTIEEDEDGYQYVKRYKVTWNHM